MGKVGKKGKRMKPVKEVGQYMDEDKVGEVKGDDKDD